ncbi:MAG: endonuclease [bacterium]
MNNDLVLKYMIIDLYNKIPRKFFLVFFVISIIWLLFAVFFVDNRWWWFLLEIAMIGVVTLDAYRGIVYKRTIWNLRVKYALRLFTSIFALFILVCGIFITAKWFYALFFIIVLLFISGSLNISNENPSKDDIKIIRYSLIGLFIIIFGLFCIPSFFANANTNPKDRFSSEYSAVSSYQIYGVGLSDREHVIPKNWYSSDDNFVNDYINVIWANKKANNRRSNLEFAIIKKSQENTLYDNDVIVGYLDGEYFMPTEEFKGDVARIVLYMYVTYKDDGLSKEHINIGLMKTWSHQDPVDDRERDRNELIFQQYGYKNKFVSTPWLVGFIV